MKKRVLITGIHGFIGSSLKRFLENNGRLFDIFGVSNAGDSDEKILTLDLTHEKELCRFFKKIKPHYIFHLAGGRPDSEEKIFRSNFLTTKSLFESLIKSGCRKTRVIIPGTAAEYGNIAGDGRLISEDGGVSPTSWYGLAKYMQTSLSLTYTQKGLDVIVVRMFNIIGKGVPPTLAIGKFAREIAAIEKGVQPAVIETKNLGGKRDFLDINDVCAALIKIAQKGKKGEIYNICSGRTCLVGDLLGKLLGRARLKNISIKEDTRNLSESFGVIGSNAKLRRTISWKPVVTIERSLQETLNYYRGLL